MKQLSLCNSRAALSKSLPRELLIPSDTPADNNTVRYVTAFWTKSQDRLNFLYEL